MQLVLRKGEFFGFFGSKDERSFDRKIEGQKWGADLLRQKYGRQEYSGKLVRFQQAGFERYYRATRLSFLNRSIALQIVTIRSNPAGYGSACRQGLFACFFRRLV